MASFQLVALTASPWTTHPPWGWPSLGATGPSASRRHAKSMNSQLPQPRTDESRRVERLFPSWLLSTLSWRANAARNAGNLVGITANGRVMLRGSAWGLLYNLTQVVVGIVSVPLTIGYLGTERYGLWTLAVSMITLARFLDVGMTPSLTNRMAAAYASGDSEELAFLGSGVLTLEIIGCLIVVALTPLIPVFDWASLLGVKGQLARREVTPFLQVVFLTGALSTVLASVESIYMARLQVSVPRIYGILSTLASLAALIVATRIHLGLPALGVSVMGARVVSRGLLVARVLMERSLRVIGRGLPKLVVQLLPVSSVFMAVQVSETVLGSIPYLIMSRTTGLSEVAVFGVASRFCSVPLGMLAAVLPTCWTVFTVAWRRGEVHWLRERLLWNILLTGASCLAYSALLYFAGDRILHLWTRGRLTAPKGLFLALGGWLTVQAAVYWLNTFLHSITDIKIEVLCNITSILLVGSLCVLFTVKWGATGAAAALAVGITVGSLVPMAVRVRRRLVSGI